MQRLGAGQLLAVDGKAQARHGLVEKPRPGGAAGDVFLVQQLLDLVGKLMRAEGADVAQPGCIVPELRAFELRREIGLLDPVELQREEQQHRGDGVDLLLHVLEEAPGLGVLHVAGIDQRGVAHDPAERLLQPLVLGDRRAQRRARQRRELALVACAERRRLRLAPFQVAPQLGAVAAGVEVAQVPFRQGAERGRGHAGGGFGVALRGHRSLLGGCRTSIWSLGPASPIGRVFRPGGKTRTTAKKALPARSDAGTGGSHGLSHLSQPRRHVLRMGGDEGGPALPVGKARRRLPADHLARSGGAGDGARPWPAQPRRGTRRPRRPRRREPAGMDDRRSRHHDRGRHHGAGLYHPYRRGPPPSAVQQRRQGGHRLHRGARAPGACRRPIRSRPSPPSSPWRRPPAASSLMPRSIPGRR